MYRLACGAILALAAVAYPAAPPKPLAIVKPVFYEYEGGPARSAEPTYNPGETVFFSFLIQGYKASEDSKIDLQYQITAVDPQGTELAEPLRGEIKSELAPEDKDWMPKISQSVPVPPLTVPGTFRILITVKDALAGAEVKSEIPFRVGGRQVAPSDTLTVRDFRFLRNETDRTPLTAAIYHPGESLWARFDIVGYRLGPKNQINVEYGLSVLGGTGKAIYTEPRAAVEDTSSFYPKRYLLGALSLNLEKARPGDYTIVLTVRDNVGNQTFEDRYPFKVE